MILVLPRLAFVRIRTCRCGCFLRKIWFAGHVNTSCITFAFSQCWHWKVQWWVTVFTSARNWLCSRSNLLHCYILSFQRHVWHATTWVWDEVNMCCFTSIIHFKGLEFITSLALPLMLMFLFRAMELQSWLTRTGMLCQNCCQTCFM